MDLELKRPVYKKKRLHFGNAWNQFNSISKTFTLGFKIKITIIYNINYHIYNMHTIHKKETDVKSFIREIMALMFLLGYELSKIVFS